MAKNFPNMEKNDSIQVQEAQKRPIKFNPRTNSPRHIITILSKITGKEKILEASREKKHITFNRTPAFSRFLSRNPGGQERVG